MKRVKAINGYTIYEMTARDEKNGDGIEGEFSIYFSSDVREYGVKYSDPEYEGLETLEQAIEMISDDESRIYAQAKNELSEEYTAITFEDIEERVNEIKAQEGATMTENTNVKYLGEFDNMGDVVTAMFNACDEFVKATVEEMKAQEGETMNETTNVTESMTYFEARETYSELFRKYPEVSSVFTDSEEIKPIEYTCTHYEKRGARWAEVESKRTACNYVTYYNVVDPRASRFMRNLGGYERTTCNYTKRGYIPTECVSISPDRTEKTVRTFKF